MKRILLSRIGVVLVVLGLCAVVSRAQVPTNLTVNMVALGACNTTTNFRIADPCQFQLTIQVPANQPTPLIVEIDSSDNSSKIIAQICRPTITWGSNYNLTTAPYPQMISSQNTSQFDGVTIDLGWLKNSGTSTTAADNTITILFNTVVIWNGQSNGQNMYITASVEYYNQTEIWVGQGSMVFQSDSLVTGTTVSFNTTTGSGSVEQGAFGSFIATLQIPNSRYHSVSFTASSSALSNNPIKVCSVHVYSAGACYSCLDSTKANIFSVVAKDQNSATLNLGYITNLGVNSANLIGLTANTGNTFITVFVTYKVSETATVSSNNPITLTASVVFSPSNATGSATFTYTPTVIAASATAPAPLPTISALISSTPVSIHQAFNISMLIQLPPTYDNLLQVDVIPTQNSSDLMPRVKLCSAVVTYSGENIPCGKCINSGVLKPYAQDTTASNVHDSFSYYVKKVKNFGLRSTSDDPNVNNVTISVIGQVLSHPLNTYGANISIPIGVTFGNQTIWIGEGYVIVGGSANYSNLVNATLPAFSMSVADQLTSTAQPGQPRAIFLDIYTKPGSIYQPMTVEVIMPETVLGNSIPAATVCRVEMYYTGVYSVCAQPTYTNAYDVSYLSRMIQFKNDKAVVTLDALCNSADPSKTMDDIDGLVRFLIYFTLNNDPTLTSSVYIGASVDLDPNTIFVGQLQFTTGLPLPTGVISSSLYGYQNTSSSNTSVTGLAFGATNYVIKIPPGTLFGYNFQTSKN